MQKNLVKRRKANQNLMVKSQKRMQNRKRKI